MSTLRITGSINIIERILKDLSISYILTDVSDYKKDSRSKNYRVYCTLIPKKE